MGRGLLVFKGENKIPKSKSKSKKKKKSSSSQRNNTISNETSIVDSVVTSKSDQSSDNNTSQTSEQPNMHQIQKGSGKIVSSGTVITGIGTKFSSEFTSGDALIASPSSSSQQEEMRVVTMCLSDTSCAISSAFSKDLKNATQFSYIRKPKNEKQDKEHALLKQKEEWMETERTAFGTYAGGAGDASSGGNGKYNQVLIYRKKTETGSYVIEKETLNQNVTRDDLLDMRTKKKSDRYC